MPLEQQSPAGENTPVVPPETPSEKPENDAASVPENDMYQMMWNLANFTTVALATSGAIVFIQSPIRTILINLTQNQNFIPNYTGGTFGLFRTLYAGTTASLSGSVVRSAYVTGAKNNKPVEALTESAVKEELVLNESGHKKTSKAKMGYVMSAAFGDIIVTQIPESLSQLKKVQGLLPEGFKWFTPNNVYKLMSGGFTARYCAGLVNFTSICLLEEEVAEALPVENKKLKHFMAGAISGAAASFCSYPFALFKDYTMVQSTVTNGKLENKSSLTALKEMSQEFIANPKHATKGFLVNAGKQMPLRMTLTATIFSVVAGVSETLGTEPLKAVLPEPSKPSPARAPQGFFSRFTADVEVDDEVSTMDYTVRMVVPGKK